MKTDRIASDRVVNQIKSLVENCASPLKIDIAGIVLYGSRARGDNNSQSDYEIVVMVDDEIDLNRFIKFTNTIRIELLKEKLFNVKVLAYTPQIFEEMLYNDAFVGTFLYMICRDNVILYEKYGIFTAIKERLAKSDIKSEEAFLAQCVEFARMLGSEKWKQKWEKILMQFKYMKNRRNAY